MSKEGLRELVRVERGGNFFELFADLKEDFFQTIGVDGDRSFQAEFFFNSPLGAC